MAVSKELTDGIKGVGEQLPRLALLAVIVAVLMPAANYSYRLSDPTPAKLLVAICIGVFSSVVCLWILDAVAILRFRSEWVARSVWGAAIASILGTGVGVFHGALAERQYPFEGTWMVRVYSPADKAFLAERQAVIMYSQSAKIYWGYSEASYPSPENAKVAVASEIVEFDPKKPHIVLRLLFADGKQIVLDQLLHVDTADVAFRSGASTSDLSITMTRSR